MSGKHSLHKNATIKYISYDSLIKRKQYLFQGVNDLLFCIKFYHPLGCRSDIFLRLSIREVTHQTNS